MLADASQTLLRVCTPFFIFFFNISGERRLILSCSRLWWVFGQLKRALVELLFILTWQSCGWTDTMQATIQIFQTSLVWFLFSLSFKVFCEGLCSPYCNLAFHHGVRCCTSEASLVWRGDEEREYPASPTFSTART